eukprot:jgi/Botrbrau1/6090/Bobra.177_1s0028.1
MGAHWSLIDGLLDSGSVSDHIYLQPYISHLCYVYNRLSSGPRGASVMHGQAMGILRGHHHSKAYFCTHPACANALLSATCATKSKLYNFDFVSHITALLGVWWCRSSRSIRHGQLSLFSHDVNSACTLLVLTPDLCTFYSLALIHIQVATL